MLLCSVSPSESNINKCTCTCFFSSYMCHHVVFRGEKGFKKELCFLLVITIFPILKLKVLLYFLKLGPIFVGTSPYEFMKYNNLLLSQSFYKIQKKKFHDRTNIKCTPSFVFFGFHLPLHLCLVLGRTVSYIINQSKSRSSVFNLYNCFFVHSRLGKSSEM